MTAILVILTFVVFALLHYIFVQRRQIQPAAAEAESLPGRSPQAPSVGGFHLPENLRYHGGHSWILKERPRLYRVGMDEFAAALAGPVQEIELPRPGQWIRQGQKAWALHREGEKAEMSSPTEGEVVEVNSQLLRDPSLLNGDPYGEGWIMRVHVPDEEGTSRNLLPPSLVEWWMRDAVERLYALQPEFAGKVAADGGHPVTDIAAALPGTSWSKLTSEFFLT